MTLSIGFVVAYGEPGRSFFADSLLAHLCGVAEAAGHRAELVRVYYHGRDRARDAEVSERLREWLDARACDLVVTDRVFDVEPLRARSALVPHRRSLLIQRGDSFDTVPGIDLVLGAVPGRVRGGGTRRTATVPELRRSFERLLAGEAEALIPGLARVEDGQLVMGPPLEGEPSTGPFLVRTRDDVISPAGPPPAVTHKTLFGNAGCPYADDPLATEHYRDLTLPPGAARLGCAFCAMGGDYEKRPNEEVIASLVEQALVWSRELPSLEAFVLDDQAPLRYLAALLRAARDAGVRPARWLFAARADGFVRERSRVEDAIAAARATGQQVEVYLSGFESFSDAELARFNKGVTADDLARALAAMRELARAHPAQFSYANARGHSLILWSPWTTPDDLATSTARIRSEGARELFHELGKNRLRLYDDLPIRAAAARDGALTAQWEAGDEGEGRRKGYNVEQPWRFLDRRTRVAHALGELLRQRLGRETELSQLSAVARYAARLPSEEATPAAVANVERGLSALEAAITALTGPPGPRRPPRARTTRAAPALFAGACNNGCETCCNRDYFLDDSTSAIAERIARARADGIPVVLAGREPTVHPHFGELVARAAGPDSRAVCVVTNGRMFSVAAFTKRAHLAGLRAASLKVFAAREEESDRITRASGAHGQALLGLKQLDALGVLVEVRVALHRENLGSLTELIELGRPIRVECALDALELDRLSDAASALARLSERCREHGVPLEASPLSAGTTLFTRIPA